MRKDDYISLVQWAKLSGVNPVTARMWAQQGKLKSAIHIGRSWAVRKNEALPKDMRFRENWED